MYIQKIDIKDDAFEAITFENEFFVNSIASQDIMSQPTLDDTQLDSSHLPLVLNLGMANCRGARQP
eukprot:693968-Ditylum_brightwellii.AAC.1